MKSFIIVSLFCIIILTGFIVWWLLSSSGKKISNYVNSTEKYIHPFTYQIVHNAIKRYTPSYLNIEMGDYSNEPFNKTVYRTWCGETSDCGGRILNSDVFKTTLQALGSDWRQIIYTNKQVIEFIEIEFGVDHKITKAYNLINPKYGAARADLFRLLIIYKKGGLYLDIKSSVINPLPPIPPGKDIWVSSWDGMDNPPHVHLFPTTGEYQNWYIYGRKGSPILLDAIERIVSNIYELHLNPYSGLRLLHPEYSEEATSAKFLVISTTGPIAFTVAVMNSKHNNTLYYDNSINNSLIYSQHYSPIGPMHYSYQTEPLIYNKTTTMSIPRVVYMIHDDLTSLPETVLTNIKTFCSGYKVKIYDYDRCRDFLRTYYGNDAISIFDNMKLPAHKAHFFKLCVLYIFGGYYFDINNVNFQVHLDDILDDTIDAWYGVADKSGKTILDGGMIATPSYNNVLMKAIKHIYMNPTPYYQSIYLDKLYTLIVNRSENRNTKNNIVSILEDNLVCILFKEECKGIDCSITDSNDKKIFTVK